MTDVLVYASASEQSLPVVPLGIVYIDVPIPGSTTYQLSLGGDDAQTK